MDRLFVRYGSLAAALTLAAAVLSAASGCRNLLATVMWVTGGNNVPAAYNGLREKKVAVVCRPVASLTYRHNVAHDLARRIGSLLRSNVPKIIEVIDQGEVAEWTDENLWEEYAEIGQAVGADVVVGIDLQDFTIYQGQTLYQGKANAAIRVYDCTNGGELVFEKILPQVVYPPNGAVETSTKPEAEFRRQFLGVLADQIGRHFYAHDAYADFAMGATALH